MATEPRPERVQKLLARAGLGSRREMERCLLEGRVRCNGQLARVGDHAVPGDVLCLDGRRVTLRSLAVRREALLYFKAPGEICAKRDPQGRPDVYRCLPRAETPWISVGRLDFNTSGVLLFTNDGELAHGLMHPGRAVEREYLARVSDPVDAGMLERLCAGIWIDGRLARFEDVQSVRPDGVPRGRHQWFCSVVVEGGNHVVKKLWESQGVRVSRLKRVRYGNIMLPSDLRQGQWQMLSSEQLDRLAHLAGVSAPARNDPDA